MKIAAAKVGRADLLSTALPAQNLPGAKSGDARNKIFTKDIFKRD